MIESRGLMRNAERERLTSNYKRATRTRLYARAWMNVCVRRQCAPASGMSILRVLPSPESVVFVDFA
jgi:hypothetical protein